MKRIIYIIVLLIAFCVGNVKAQNVVLNAEIDTFQMMIGEQTRIRLELSVDTGYRVVMPEPAKELMPGIEVLEKKGDMFNARHILLKPEYTSEDREKGFRVLDSLKTELANEAVTFEMAARFYSEDPATRTNGGQMADPNTGSSYFEIDQLKPQDYAAIKSLEVGQVSEPFESLDNEGRNGNTVYKILKVDKIIPAHTASFSNDYDILLGQAKNKKSMAAIDEFIKSKIKSTLIIIDPLFKDCEFEREGWEEKFRK